MQDKELQDPTICNTLYSSRDPVGIWSGGMRSVGHQYTGKKRKRSNAAFDVLVSVTPL